jgi:hypothetical protein
VNDVLNSLTAPRAATPGTSPRTPNELVAEPKELYVVPNRGHVDLYDKTDLIPFDKLEEFFTKNLA